MRVSDPLTPSMQAALQGGLLHELNRAVGLTIAKRVRLPRGREADEGPKDGQGALHHSRAAVTRTKLLNGHGGTARHPRRMLHEVDVEGGAEEDTGQSSSDREQDHSTPRRSLPILGPTLPFRHFDANDRHVRPDESHPRLQDREGHVLKTPVQQSGVVFLEVSAAARRPTRPSGLRSAVEMGVALNNSRGFRG